MSAFNPRNRQLTPEEWRDIAHDRVGETNSQYTVIAGIVLGMFAAAAASPVTGGLVAVFFLHKAWKDTQQANRNDKAIEGYGCVAHVLAGDDLRDFAAQVGTEEVQRQVRWAHDRGLAISADAQDFIDEALPPLLPPSRAIAPSQLTQSEPKPAAASESATEPAKKPEGAAAAVGQTTRLNATPVPSRRAEPLELVDIASAIANPLKPLIVTAKPRVGKGIIVSHAWRAARESYPGLTVWVIQPKPHPKESGYWAGVDRFWGKMVEDFAPNDETIAEELTNFILDWRQQASRPTLLIIDELVKLEACLPRWYKAVIPALLKVEASSGETDARFLWAITQSPLATDLGITLGTRNTFEFLTVQKATTIDHAETVRRSIDSIKSIPQEVDFTASPVGALAFHSAANRWMAVPRYDVPSPVDHDAQPPVAPPAPECRLEQLAAEYDRLNLQPLMGDFLRWLKTRQTARNGIITIRDAVTSWGTKKDRGITRNDDAKPFFIEAVSLGLLVETPDGYQIVAD